MGPRWCDLCKASLEDGDPWTFGGTECMRGHLTVLAMWGGVDDRLRGSLGQKKGPGASWDKEGAGGGVDSAEEITGTPRKARRSQEALRLFRGKPKSQARGGSGRGRGAVLNQKFKTTHLKYGCKIGRLLPAPRSKKREARQADRRN